MGRGSEGRDPGNAGVAGRVVVTPGGHDRSGGVPETGLSREQASAWLLARCRGVSEYDADQVLDDAVIDADAALGGYTVRWDRGTGFAIGLTRPGGTARAVAYWGGAAAVLAVYAIEGFISRHTVVPVIAAACALLAVIGAGQKLALLVRQRRGGYPGAARSPARSRHPRAILVGWMGAEAAAFREFRAALTRHRMP